MKTQTILNSRSPLSTRLIQKSPTTNSTLPVDLLTSASHRLKWASLIYGCALLVVYGAYIIVEPEFRTRQTFAVEAIVVGLSAVMALLVFFAATTRRFRPTTLLDIGLMFEVAGGFGISMVEHWGFFGGGEFKIFGVSWICVWIVIFPLIVPSTPGKSMLAAFVTATTGIAAYTLSTAFYKADVQPVATLIPLFLPNYICTLLAFLTAKVVYNLGADVRDARQMGAYELEQRLGRGGMGEVWRAHHQFLSRPAAIKLIRPEVLSSDGGLYGMDLLRRFEREVQATATLRSPHSIVLFDFGATEEGTFYYVMELLSGLNLQKLVERFGPLPTNRVVFILEQICHSLKDAHCSGLIHRDVKPANIYLCRLGTDYDFVKVLDFGLVKRLTPQEESGISVTRGGLCGTPGFIAPEIILGGNAADPRADIYSFGCVAYWLLTGHLVFSGATSDEVMRGHVASDPVAPSKRGELPIPEELDDLVMNCLSKRPEDRTATMDDVETRLKDFGIGPTWTNDDARRWWETHRPQEDHAPDST